MPTESLPRDSYSGSVSALRPCSTASVGLKGAVGQWRANGFAAMTWAQRPTRVLGIDIATCPACGGAEQWPTAGADGREEALPPGEKGVYLSYSRPLIIPSVLRYGVVAAH